MRYRSSDFWNRNSNFLTLQTSEFKKYFPTGIFGIQNGIGIPLSMGVPEIGTENWNSQPSPPMRGTFWATFGQSPLRDKVLQWGAHFGPHLVEVHCVTKSSNEGHILGHIWSKSAVRESPPTRGIFVFATFGHCLLRDICVQWPIMGIIFWPHLTKVRCVTRFPFYARFGQRQLIDMHLSLVIFQFLWMPIAWASQPTLPTWPLFPRGPISRELPTKFFSSTTYWSVWLEASKPIPSPLLGPSTRVLYAPNTVTPPRLISIWPANPLPSLETCPTKWVSLVWSR